VAHPRPQSLALLGLLINVALAAAKFLAGLLGHSYALIADAIESLTDILSSAILWGGLRIANRPATDRHPYGYGKAESLAAAVVSLIILAAGVGIAIEAIREILTPHHAPAPFTLAVLAAAILIKEALFRYVRRVARATGSPAVHTDAWHHRADAITSAAAFIGISTALIGGPGWEVADDYAALLASAIIILNAARLLAPPVRELLDVQFQPVVEQARVIAAENPRVLNVQKTMARKSGTQYWLDMHIWVDPEMSVRDAHTLAHAIKDAIRAANPSIQDILIHVEPAPPPDKGPPGPRTPGLGAQDLGLRT
jgi:cation diffusion facilitator family transporter